MRIVSWHLSMLPHTMRAIPSLGLGLIVLACSAKQPPPPPYSDAALRDELLARVATDQAVRDTFAQELRATGQLTPAIVASLRAVDSANVAWLKPLLEARGLPTPAEVGIDGVAAVTLLIQHADADPTFQAAALPLLDAAFRAGYVTGQEVAMLTDRVAKGQGLPQRFGTQSTIRDGQVVIDPIEDSADVDVRRAAMGLPPLAYYKKVLDSAYALQTRP